MNLVVKKITENIVLISPREYDKDVDWQYKFQLTANKIFSPPSTMIIVAIDHLRDILCDDAKDFRNYLDNSQKNNEYLREKHNFMIHEMINNGTKWIITSLYNPPKTVIDDLITSQEFIWRNMFLICWDQVMFTKLSEDLLNDIKKFLNTSPLEIPKIKCQLLESYDDGCQLCWYNPTFNVLE